MESHLIEFDGEYYPCDEDLIQEEVSSCKADWKEGNKYTCHKRPTIRVYKLIKELTEK